MFVFESACLKRLKAGPESAFKELLPIWLQNSAISMNVDMATKWYPFPCSRFFRHFRRMLSRIGWLPTFVHWLWRLVPVASGWVQVTRFFWAKPSKQIFKTKRKPSKVYITCLTLKMIGTFYLMIQVRFGVFFVEGWGNLVLWVFFTQKNLLGQMLFNSKCLSQQTTCLLANPLMTRDDTLII